MDKIPDNDPAKSPPPRGGFRWGRIFSSRSLLWKGSFALVFVCTGIGMLVEFGFKDKLMAAFAGVLVLYGISRFFAFYTEYKSNDEE